MGGTVMRRDVRSGPQEHFSSWDVEQINFTGHTMLSLSNETITIKFYECTLS